MKLHHGSYITLLNLQHILISNGIALKFVVFFFFLKVVIIHAWLSFRKILHLKTASPKTYVGIPIPVCQSINPSEECIKKSHHARVGPSCTEQFSSSCAHFTYPCIMSIFHVQTHLAIQCVKTWPVISQKGLKSGLMGSFL